MITVASSLVNGNIMFDVKNWKLHLDELLKWCFKLILIELIEYLLGRVNLRPGCDYFETWIIWSLLLSWGGSNNHWCLKQVLTIEMFTSCLISRHEERRVRICHEIKLLKYFNICFQQQQDFYWPVVMINWRRKNCCCCDQVSPVLSSHSFSQQQTETRVERDFVKIRN